MSAATVLVGSATVPGASAVTTGRCLRSGALTTLMSTGTLLGRAESGFVTMGFDPATGAAYVPHFLGGKNVLTSYVPSSHKVLKCAYSVSSNKSDTHDGANVHVDSAGYLHVVTGRHGAAPFYERSARAHDPSFAGGMVQPASLLDDKLPLPGATYPQLYSDPADSDRLIVVARQRTSQGNAKVEMTRSDDHGDTWSPAQVLVDMTATDPTAKVYVDLVQGPDAALHLVFTPHQEVDGGQCDPYDNRTVFYATSPDFGQSWTRADGTVLTLPMTAQTADQVVAAAAPSQRVQAALGMPMAFDAQNRPIVFFRQWDDTGCTRPDDNPAAVESSRWDGSAWESPVAVDPEPANSDYAVAQLQPSGVIEVYATRIYGGVPILVVHRSADYGQTWDRLQCLDSTTTGSLTVWQSHNQTQHNEDMIQYGSGTAGYLLDRTDGGDQVACPADSAGQPRASVSRA